MKLIKFSAIWCPACLIMNSRYYKLQKEYNYDITDYDYDTDTNKVEEYHIGSTLPVVMIEDDDHNELERIVGEISEKKLRQIIERRLS